MYLANCTRPNIDFVINLLAKYSSTHTKIHWNRVKHILRYLRGTAKMRLFYSGSNSLLIGYVDASYLSDLYKERSQTSYLFTYRGNAISWRSVIQILVVVSSNHLEIIAIHEASREYIWLRSILQDIKKIWIVNH